MCIRDRLEGLPGALDLEILDEDDGVAVGQQVAGGILDLDLVRRGGRSRDLGGRPPLPGRLVVDVIVVGHLLSLSHDRGKSPGPTALAERGP